MSVLPPDIFETKRRKREELFTSFLQHINDDYHELLDKEDQLKAEERAIQEKHEELGELEVQITRVDLLQRENDRLRREIHSKSTRLEAVEAENYRLRCEAELLRSELTGIHQESEAKLRALQAQQEERAPNAVIQEYGSDGDRPESVLYKDYEQLCRFYRGLYEDKKTALGTYFVLASKHKRSKAKSKEWERLFKRDEFEVMVDGEPARFRRVLGVEVPNINPIDTERGVSFSNSIQIPQSSRKSPNAEGASEYVSANCGRSQIPQTRTSPNVEHAGERVTARRETVQPPSSTRASPDNTASEDAGLETTLPRVLEIPRSSRESSAIVPTSTTELRSASDDDPSSTQSQDPRWPDQDLPAHLSEYSSDPPTVVAERSVGRKSTDTKLSVSGTCRPLFKETGSLTRPVTVKSESSSESLNLSTMRQYDPLATQDQEEHCTPDLDYNIQSRKPGFRIYNEPQPPVASPPSNSSENRSKTIPSQRSAKRPALQLLDNNALPATPQRLDGKESYQTPKRRKREDCGAAAVRHIAEDGEEENYRRDKAAFKTPNARSSSRTSTPAQLTGDRLISLLAGQHGPKPILTPPNTNRKFQTIHKPAGLHQTTITKSMATTPRTPQSALSHDKEATPTTATGEPYDATPDDEPLRARPVHRLGREHFKINPARNQGLDYAFQDVVRNKDERKCLSGCIRPECCGPMFRAMAVEGRMGRPSVPETVTLNNLDEEDRRLLDEFLGDGKGALTTMPKKELRELLVDARTRQLADQFGKHRHAHERARSPPGFWRTDMPTTQENERDRDHAKELERIKVVERYREALKPGGRWIFADE